MRAKMNILRYEYESEDDFMLKSLGFFNTGESKWNPSFVEEGLHSACVVIVKVRLEMMITGEIQMGRIDIVYN